MKNTIIFVSSAFVGFVIVLLFLWATIDIGPAEEPEVVDDAPVLDVVPCHEPTGAQPGDVE
jgi:hypothetical protein